MSLIDTTASFLHGGYAVRNVIQFLPTLSGNRTTPDGFALVYPPFAVGTNLALALAPTKFRVVHSIASLVVGGPHWEWHSGSSVVYLVAVASQWQREPTPNTTKKNNPIPIAGRILAGFLGISQLGSSLFFTSKYLMGDPFVYEPFLARILEFQDKIPPNILTSDFIRGVYLAGTYTILPIGWSHGVLLIQSILKNSRQDCVAVLKSMASTLGTQILLHSAAWIMGGGGQSLNQYMYNQGPMGLPALGMIGAALYLCLPKKEDDRKAKSL